MLRSGSGGSGGRSLGQSGSILAGCWGLEIAVESRGVHRWVDGARDRACVPVSPGMCLRPGEDTALCAGSYLNESCQEEWLSLASLDRPAFACPPGTMSPRRHLPDGSPFSLWRCLLPTKSGYQSAGPRAPPWLSLLFHLLPGKPSRCWTLDQFQGERCPKKPPQLFSRRGSHSI